MTMRRELTDEFSFAAEGMAGTAAALALRRVRSLADQLPSSRMFASIATLTEISRRIETSLETAHDAFASGDGDTAALEFARSIVQMDRLAAAAGHEPDKADKLPEYLRKRR
ncbi:MAG: hypothetical protein ACRESZ_00690 [Methylococcales bacterium]